MISGLFRCAALRCVGVGNCRKKSGQDDVPKLSGHPRRGAFLLAGRARLLWEMLNGRELKTDGRAMRLNIPSTFAFPARKAAKATARCRSTWRPTRPSSCPTTMLTGCGRAMRMPSGGIHNWSRLESSTKSSATSDLMLPSSPPRERTKRRNRFWRRWACPSVIAQRSLPQLPRPN